MFTKLADSCRRWSQLNASSTLHDWSKSECSRTPAALLSQQMSRCSASRSGGSDDSCCATSAAAPKRDPQCAADVSPRRGSGTASISWRSDLNPMAVAIRTQGVGRAEGAHLEQSVNHDAQALRDKLSGWHGHHRRRGAGKRRAEPQRIRTVNAEFTDDTDDNDDIRNQRSISGSYGLLTDQERAWSSGSAKYP
jgi:hypothetical protein